MKIAVIGTGTAGILSISFILTYLKKEDSVEVYSIHNPKKPILGIGEATSTQIPSVLFDCINFNLLENSKELDAMIKLGVKFSDWREEEFYSHIMPVNYAMHFNNHSLKDYSFKKFNELYKNFKEIHGNVDVLESDKDKAKVIVDGKEYNFDYVIDCGGYPENYTDYNLNKHISLNSCLVHNTKPEEYYYTHHKATPNGWMFGIPLQTRQSWGYLYNDTITSKEDAIDNFKTYCNDIVDSKLKEFKFKSYSAKTFFDGRILKNGNRALFYEPMEAFMGFFYDQVLRFFFDYLYSGFGVDLVNQNIQKVANNIELAICFVYHGGSIYNTPFWDYAKKLSNDKLNNDLVWQYHLHTINQIKNNNFNQIRLKSVGAFPVKSWLDFDKNLNYNLWN